MGKEEGFSLVQWKERDFYLDDQNHQIAANNYSTLHYGLKVSDPKILNFPPESLS